MRATASIDVRDRTWGVEDDAPFDAVISLNMLHIAPWEAALGLLARAGELLRLDGILFFYGPFMREGRHTAASNAAFDFDLRKRDSRWGVRDVDDLVGEAAIHGLEPRDVVRMPANNLTRLYQAVFDSPRLAAMVRCVAHWPWARLGAKKRTSDGRLRARRSLLLRVRSPFSSMNPYSLRREFAAILRGS